MSASRAVARTIARAVEHEIDKRKGSRFIAAAWPLPRGGGRPAEDHVRDILVQQRAQFPKACHHCYAYRATGGRELCSDDGEPHSTAGKPILAALQRAELVDVCVVVSRIFGGVKLGTGGLIRAYGAAAAEVLARAEPVAIVPMQTLRIRCLFEHFDVVMQAAARFQLQIGEETYAAADATLVAQVPQALAAQLEAYLLGQSAGQIAIDRIHDEI